MEKAKCRAETGKLLRSGAITRSLTCECGQPAVDCHHNDYNNPADVVWLCKKCHNKRHLVQNNTCFRCGSSWSSKLKRPKSCYICNSRTWDLPVLRHGYMETAIRREINLAVL